MPARVVIVLTEPGAAQDVANLLAVDTRDVLALTNSLRALDALEGAGTIEVLVTCAEFGPGQPNGIALIRLARRRRTSIRALCIGEPEHARFVAGLGAFLRSPVTAARIADVVNAMLGPKPPAA